MATRQKVDLKTRLDLIDAGVQFVYFLLLRVLSHIRFCTGCGAPLDLCLPPLNVEDTETDDPCIWAVRDFSKECRRQPAVALGWETNLVSDATRRVEAFLAIPFDFGDERKCFSGGCYDHWLGSDGLGGIVCVVQRLDKALHKSALPLMPHLFPEQGRALIAWPPMPFFSPHPEFIEYAWERLPGWFYPWHRMIQSARMTIDAAMAQAAGGGKSKGAASREGKKQREPVTWECPKGTYLEVGAKIVYLVQKDDKGNIQSKKRIRMERNTRAWAIVQHCLVDPFPSGDVLKREVESIVGKPIKDSISHVVAKENRQVFAPRIRKYLPDFPKDVVQYDPNSKRYGFTIALMPALKD